MTFDKLEDLTKCTASISSNNTQVAAINASPTCDKLTDATAHDHHLIDYHSLPDWMKDNPDIHRYYRRPMSNFGRCLHTSLFWYHNESINTWSHLLAAMFFAFLLIYLIVHGIHIKKFLHLAPDSFRHTYLHSLDALSETAAHLWNDIVPVQKLRFRNLGWIQVLESFHNVNPTHQDSDDHHQGVLEALEGLATLLQEHQLAMLPLLSGAILCTISSALFHAVWNHSPYALHIFSKFDYAGIILLTTGHSITGAYYLFYCLPEVVFHRYALLLVAVCIPTVAFIFHPRFGTPEFRVVRTVWFVGYGILCGVFPMAFLSYAHGTVRVFIFDVEFYNHLRSMIKMAVFYLMGAFCFATRCPERWFPGKFDRLGNSHQILHVCVAIAAFVHWQGCYDSFQYRVTHGCPTCDTGML